MIELLPWAAVPAGTAAAPSVALPGYPQSALLNQAHTFWLHRRAAAEMPSWQDMNTRFFDQLRPHAILFEVEHQPLDFRSAEIGSRIAAVSNADHLGRLLSALPPHRPPSRAWDHLQAPSHAPAPD